MTSQLQADTKNDDINSSKPKNVFIKKAILENFLSFQKDEVEFGDSKFIIVVGPNWSGKTSIFQAIKFALGSNERDERYSKWSSFIRDGQNHARVEIHIQNGNELIKLRRTVIREKSPFYEIQRETDEDFKRAQAIEIQKLVADLNINPDNQFAFVSQGKIDAIKNLRPTELCSFLEEGIGLKKLREEILQQKSRVLTLDSDLKALISRKNSLNFNLDLLNPKLERLKQKKSLLEIKNKINDELLWANRKKLKEEIDKIDYDIVVIQANINQIKRTIEDNENTIKILRKKISEIELNVNQLSEKLGELNYKKQELIAKIQNWQKEKITMKQELDALGEKINKAEKTRNNFEKQKESIENEFKIINEEKINIERLIDDLIQEQNQLANKIKQNKIFLDEYNQLIVEKKEKLSEIQKNEESIKTINDEINQLFQSFKDIEHKLEMNKWFLKNPSANLLQQLDQDLKKASTRAYEIDLELKQLEFDKSKKLSKVTLLQGSLRERKVILPSNINILKEEIQKRNLKIKGPIIEYLKYDDDLSYAIESVLGEKLLYSFIAENWDTLNLLKKLKDKYNSYCNIYVPKNLKIAPLNKITGNGIVGYLSELIEIIDNDIDVKKVIYSKVKNCLVVKDYLSGRELYKMQDFKGMCVTLKGEQIISYKYVYETPYLKRLKGILSAVTQQEQSHVLESEIKALNDRISELKVEQSKLDEHQREIYKKKESFNDLLYNFNQKQRLTTKKNQLYEHAHALEGNNKKIREKVDDLDGKIKSLESQKHPDFFKLNDRFNEIPNELNRFNEEKKKWDSKLNENNAIHQEIIIKINTHDRELNIIKLEHETKKENFQKADKVAFDIYKNLENLDKEVEEVKNNISSLQETSSELQKEKLEADRKNIQITLNLEQENFKINSKEQEIELKKIDLERINSEIGPLISEKKIEIRPFEEIKEDIKKIDKELLAYLDVDDSLLVERDQIMMSLKQIDKNQKNLEKDIKSALKTEAKMEKTYYDKFQAELEKLQTKINQKFSASQIKAFCSLQLSGDFVELGVDIKAATTKEQLKSFTALSGGQVSMISICLILSLQEIKPSPLCMFDEAGMFLDDKNTEIVYQLINSTLKQNPIQMILFLPNSSKPLYQLADKLIGVARIGKNEISSIFKPKIIKRED